MDDEYKKEQKKELLLKSKQFPRRNYIKIESKYPIAEKIYKSQLNRRYDDSNRKISTDVNKSNDSDHFLEAYQKIVETEVNRLNQLYKKNKDVLEYAYSHPGTYREFDIDNNSGAKKKKTISKLWSCCMNSDENSRGCQRRIVKKFKWILDGPII